MGVKIYIIKELQFIIAFKEYIYKTFSFELKSPFNECYTLEIIYQK